MPSRFRRRRPSWLHILGYTRETRDKIIEWRNVGLIATILFACVLQHISNQAFQSNVYSSSSLGASRKLLTAEWETCDFELSSSEGGWIVSHSICILFIFVALAIVCDDFFVPSLELISEKLQLSEDVAGATFMAAGSSAPELFTSVAGVAVETDVGVGTIVGSAVFNLLIIIALTAALAGQVLHLDWRPLIRDAFFYAMSIGCFIGFAWDGYFEHWEACVLLVLYSLYIVLMVFNPRLMDWMATWRLCCSSQVEPAADEERKASTSSGVDGQMGDGERKASKSSGCQNPDHNHDPLNLAEQSRNSNLSLTGGHARRLSLHKQAQKAMQGSHGHLTTHEAHIFHHHQRGSIAGVLSGHPTHHDHSITPESMETGPPTIKEEPVNGDVHVEGKPSQSPGVATEGGTEGGGDEEEEEEKTINLCPCLPCCCPVRTWPPSTEAIKEEGGFLNYVKFILRWVLFIPAFPFVALFSWTIPDCSKPHLRKYYLASFLMSVAWIAILSFGMVTLVGRTGCILNIDTYVMGLVVIAVGTSIPDALSSVLVARDGYGDMAVSNAIGSNVFDINLGLGLPFIIRIAIDAGDPIELLSGEEFADFNSGDLPVVPHVKFGFILLLILAIALAIFVASRFVLTRYIGVSFVIMYILFMVYAFLQELYCVRQLDTYC